MTATQAHPARRWLPTFLVDETMPEGRLRPEDWLKPDREGVTEVYYDDGEQVEGYIIPDRVVAFSWHEPRGTIEILVMPDGTWTECHPARCTATIDMFDGPPPADAPVDPRGEANLFAWSEDAETVAESLDTLAHEWAAAEHLPEEGVIVSVDRHYWSAPVRFRVSADGKSLLPYTAARPTCDEGRP